MKGFGMEVTVEELKEIVPYLGVNIIMLALVLFVLWHYRENILKIISKIIRDCLKRKPLDKKIKCINCKKKKFSFTRKNISEVLRPPRFTIPIIGFSDYRSAGDFLICENCREVVGIWKMDDTIDQYKITEHDSWNNLLKQHRVCFLAYKKHEEWIRGLNDNLTLCVIQQRPTYEMEADIIDSFTLKSRLDQTF